MSDTPAERYLVCLDGSDNSHRAADWAAALAARTGAALTLLHVVQWDGHAWTNAAQVAQLPDLHEQLESDAWEYLLTPVQTKLHDQEGLSDVDARLVFGKPAECVGEIAEEIGATLVVAGTRGHSTLVGLVVGSVAHRLLQVAKRPVVIVP